MSEYLDRLDRAVTRLMTAQQEALETCARVLDHDRPSHYDSELLEGATDFLGASQAQMAEERLFRAALEDVRAILVGASEDVQAILGEGD